MAVTDYPGAPHARIKLNDTNAAAGAEFRVYDTTTTSIKMTVEADTGDVEVTGTIKKSGAVELYNKTGGGTDLAYLYQIPALGSKTKRIELLHDATNSLATIKASTAAYAMEVEGETVDLNTVNASGTVVKFKTNGTSRLTMEYTSSKPRFTATTSADYEVTGATSDLSLIAGEHIVFKFGVSAAGECRFLAGGGTTLTKMDESGIWTWNDTAGGAEARLTPKTGGNDCLFEVGLSDSVRGVVKIDRDPVGGANNRKGVLILQDRNGNDYYVSVSTGGVLYISTANNDPGVADIAATDVKVGGQ